MASSLLSFVITIVLVALGAAASGKGKMKKTRKFIPPNPAWRNGQPVQTAQGSSVQKNVPAAKKSSGSAILDRVLRENQDTDTREYNVEETVILDSMGLSMPKIEQSPYMEEVHQMMVTGYEVKMPEQRDFVMEGLALLDQHVG